MSCICCHVGATSLFARLESLLPRLSNLVNKQVDVGGPIANQGSKYKGPRLYHSKLKRKKLFLNQCDKWIINPTRYDAKNVGGTKLSQATCGV